jgi:hypothetical protein
MGQMSPHSGCPPSTPQTWPGDEVVRVARQEDDHAADLLRRAEALERGGLARELQHLLAVLAVPLERMLLPGATR